MIGYCMYKFGVEDRDIGVVDYQTLKESTEIEFPTVTFCFFGPFLPSKLVQDNTTIDYEKYLQYLKGETFEKEYLRME